MAVLVDTGVLYALADRDDRWHRACVAWLEGLSETLLAPVTVLPEVTYLLRSRLGVRAEASFVAAVAAREIGVEALTYRDLERVVVLLETYPDLGFVDASVVATAERLGFKAIATTDRRHFAAVRPRHCAAFELLP